MKHSCCSEIQTKAISHTSVLKNQGISTYQLLLTDDEVSRLAAPDTGQVGRHLDHYQISGTTILELQFKDSDRIAQLKHSVSVIKTSKLMLYRGTVALCYEIHTKHRSTCTFRGQNVERLNDKITGTRLYH